MRSSSTITLILLILLSTGCGGSVPESSPPADVAAAPEVEPQGSVLLVLLDTTRVDKLGCYGNREGMTPRLDAFAAGAVRFERAYSHAPWTLPAAASILTSRYPSQHGASGWAGRFTVLGEEAVTVAELFRGAGFATGAVVNVLFLTERFGTAQGFDTVVGRDVEDNRLAGQASDTTDAALQWLAGLGGQRFFILVHYFDPHLTYDAPAEFTRRFILSDDDGEEAAFGTVEDMFNFRQGKLKLTRREIAGLETRHNGEVAFMDHEVGRLLDGLAELGLAGDTVVAVTADHGEEFFDHGGFEHGHSFYDELLRVPLLIRAPGVAAGAVVPTVVRHIDLAPTLCGLAGVAGHHGFEGESLVGLLRGGSGEDRPVLSQGNMWGPGGVAWRQGGYKLIRRYVNSPNQLFHLAEDPLERNDLAAADPGRCQRMADELEGVMVGLAGDTGGGAPQLTKAERGRLRALGYLD